jgi:hypothetical protein
LVCGNWRLVGLVVEGCSLTEVLLTNPGVVDSDFKSESYCWDCVESSVCP